MRPVIGTPGSGSTPPGPSNAFSGPFEPSRLGTATGTEHPTGQPALIDTHCHLQHHELLLPWELVERAHSSGVAAIVTAGTSLACSAQAVTLARRLPTVAAVVGIHPRETFEATPTVLRRLEALAGRPEVVAIATGLFPDDPVTPAPLQRWSLREHAALARALGKTLVVHAGEPWGELLDELLAAPLPATVVIQGFRSDMAAGAAFLDAGFYLSLAGDLADPAAAPLRAVVATVPPNRIVLETDSPYRIPYPDRGVPNEPAQLRRVADVVAAVLGLDTDELARLTTATARRVYDLHEQVASPVLAADG